MPQASKKLYRPPSIFNTKEVYIACLAVISIVSYLVLFYGFHTSKTVANYPLYAALFFGGVPLVYDLAIKAIRKEFGSDLLAGMSIVTAVILEQYLAGTFVVLMLSGGASLENYAVRRASSVLEALAKRMPSIAHKKMNGQIVEIALDQIVIGDQIVIFPHEISPVDGSVVEGHGIMDESFLTGEPYMIPKTPGAVVISGAINGDSSITIAATKQAKDSRYAKIMEVMLETEQKRPNLRRLGDELGAYYTPLAVLIASIAWYVSGEAIRFLAVLVIATPCPLLLAIPVAIIGSISLCARRGIVVKNPAVLEQVDKCRTMILDKTGTLTYGKPDLTEAIYFGPVEKQKGLQLAASLERYSKHPLAAAILDAAEKAKLPLLVATQISEPQGGGLYGVVEGHAVLITSRKQIKPEEVSQLPSGEGLECVILINGELAAYFKFHDSPRKESLSFIRHLGKKHGFQKVMIVSGDRQEEVKYLADQVGVKEIYAGVSPEEKVVIAAFGYLPPVAGAISQEVIDVLAILNALRVAIPPKKLTDF